MKLKGQAIFELTNVETGEKRVVKEDNIVTNGFQHLIQAGGRFANGPQHNTYSDTASNYPAMSNNNWTNITKRYTNGLLLFSDKLEEDVDHIYPTADDPIITGVGAELAYTGNLTNAGSYNNVESGPTENGYKHVWDFTTHQSNGPIGCACLTTLANGGIGCGLLPKSDSSWWGALSSEWSKNNTSQFYIPQFADAYEGWPSAPIGYYDLGRNLFIRPRKLSSVPCPSRYGGYGPSSYSTYVADEDTTKVLFTNSFIYTKSIELDVFRFPHNNFSIFDSGAEVKKSIRYSTSGSYSAHAGQTTFIKTVTVNMPQGLINLIPDDKVQASVTGSYWWPNDINYDEGFMYISFVIPSGSGDNGATLKSGDKLYVWKINMNTFESDYFTITNTTGKNLNYRNANPWLGYSHHVIHNNIITNDYTVLFSDPLNGAGNMWIIDNATSTTIKQVVNSNDEAISISNSYGAVKFVRNNLLYILQTSTSSTSTYTGVVVNLKTGLATYGAFRNEQRLYYDFNSSRQYLTILRTFGTKHPSLLFTEHNGYITDNTLYSKIHVFNDPQILMTINNLENVVTKTNAETMKVTYMLTRVED